MSPDIKKLPRVIMSVSVLLAKVGASFDAHVEQRGQDSLDKLSGIGMLSEAFFSEQKPRVENKGRTGTHR